MAIKTPTREEVHSIVERYRALSKGKRSSVTMESYVREALEGELGLDPTHEITRGDETKNLIDHIVGDLESYG